MIGFAGLSHLGIVSSIAAAAIGERVVAYDPDASRCAALKSGDVPVLEPGLLELLAEHGDRIRFSAEPALLGECEVVFLSMDVPTDAHNRSDLTPLERLLKQVAAIAGHRAALVVLSQVPPGFTRRWRAALDATSGKSQQLFYQVETLIFGRAVERALHPERIIVGCDDPEASLPGAYHRFLERFGCPVLPMQFESAELAKIAINMFLVSSVSTTNTLAELCEHMGADWNDIAPALRLDRRIGAYAYLTPGLGLSGGNLERDLVTVQRLSAENATDTGLVNVWLANSTRRREWAAQCLDRAGLLERAGATIAVWGISYKPDTASTKNSPALALLERLPGANVIAYDPVAPLEIERFPRVRRAGTALDACAGADALVVMTAWKEFSGVDVDAMAAAMRGRILIDPFGAIDRARSERSGFAHYRLGSPLPAVSH